MTRYSGTSEKARLSTSGRRVNIADRSIGVNSHLCGFTTSESASSTPASTWRISGTTAATPPYEPSTCSHMSSRAHNAAIAGTGSMLVVLVVPTVATVASGR